MRISTLMGYAGGFKEAVAEIKSLEQAGLDLVWVPEAYSFDAPTAMGYLAAETNRVTIASGILPIYTRTPSLLAMTAAGLDYLSDGRAMLGLGASGPQVIEGFHGTPYNAPVARIREIIAICRQVWRRERLQHMGTHYQIPLPQDQGTGLGKPLKLINHPVRTDIPIAIASLGPTSVATTAELADAWLPAFFTPEAARAVWGDALDQGTAKRDPQRPPLDTFAGGSVAIGEGKELLRERGRASTALYVGGMGARSKNFYNDIFAKSGYVDEAKIIQDLYLSGDKQAAAAAVPDDYLAKSALIGPEGFVRQRLYALKEAGVTSLNVSFIGETADERVAECEKLRNLVDSL
ncbi:MAG TPA: LLM class F420-dependent oxidoreductase [Gammaproteobacteria bacterium]|nr:MAG: LLM class F420-dependent oxidoreductase [Gammaproteobacteria bacterium TMED134]RPG47074.1 MAG: LLM class F420-dependent oxidoreductase [Gammaproteobacteria bacterium TMED134]RZO70479.1 MAG: LLM class F420-dependent oxidoreductase [OM182 bacterium]HAL42110.1 LLM class F420-dependent oxidoreductase [Gammaproteobacteria bacterium]HBK17748.1 LLM class F420-dependent oxidoreductase [Gammaproteobacteria bacterium]|tara:strand:+ start:13455 stop:14501 length:1047 start_codon:yes stop_codon:yes gene_type:complete